jgi:hypothetical protein
MKNTLGGVRLDHTVWVAEAHPVSQKVSLPDPPVFLIF